ncbi:MAG: hypothetical protein ABI700_18555 [Chloroflexota bacterium]
MPSPFDITTASNTVALDNKREGVAVFTIKNNLRRRLRAQARVTTQPPNAAAWLTILPSDATSTDPANVRDFPVDGTQQIQVKIAAPADAPAASYSLKLTVADETNPDDLFTDSPDVLFSIHDAPKSAPTPIPNWIIPVVLIGVAVIVIIILAGVALSNRQVGACTIKMRASQFVYTEPDTLSSNMLDQLQPDAPEIVANAKSADNKWLAFPFSSIQAWIEKALLTTTADVSGNCNDLPVVCLLEITGDQLTYLKPVLDPNNQWTKLTAGYQVVPVGKSSDSVWWQVQLGGQKAWLPTSSFGHTTRSSGDCNGLPVIAT